MYNAKKEESVYRTHSLSIHRIEFVLLDGGFHISIIFIFDQVILLKGKFDVRVTCPNGVLVLEVGGFVLFLQRICRCNSNVMKEFTNKKECVRGI